MGEAAATWRGVGGKAEGDWRVGLEMSGLFTLCTQSFLVHVKKRGAGHVLTNSHQNYSLIWTETVLYCVSCTFVVVKIENLGSLKHLKSLFKKRTLIFEGQFARAAFITKHMETGRIIQ